MDFGHAGKDPKEVIRLLLAVAAILLQFALPTNTICAHVSHIKSLLFFILQYF